MFIRKGTKNDIDELEKLYFDLNEYLDETVNYPGWKNGVYPIREDAEHGVEIDRLFVVDDEGILVGSYILSHEPENEYAKVNWNSDLTYEETYIIHTLVVHPNYLKMHIGEFMMKEIIETAKRDGVKEIRLDVFQYNTPAIRLYEKMGFIFVDTVDLGYAEYGLDLFRVYKLTL